MHQHQAIDFMEGAWFFLILAEDGLWIGPNLAENQKKLPPFFPLIRGVASFYHVSLPALQLTGQAKEWEAWEIEKTAENP